MLISTWSISLAVADDKWSGTSSPPNKWQEIGVDIKITHSDICDSDFHTLRNYPQCVGHEIVGIVVRGGSKAENDIKVGDRVGTHVNGDKSWGGYALYNRSPSHFVFKIPEIVSSATAAPMLCAGVTTYSPLKHYGGLGHFAILWAKALGVDKIIAISRKAEKAEDALKLGADAYVATDDGPNAFAEHARTLEIIISTISSAKRKKLGSSLIGSPAEIWKMLQLAADKEVQPLIEERPMKDANQAIVDLEQGKSSIWPCLGE
ncbi:GroES-like protein [Phaeosphaeriaceae sp. SRC1lsM3a]|nr:GroES-like protein [Stagonospora sp. SRC1lsM3a]